MCIVLSKKEKNDVILIINECLMVSISSAVNTEHWQRTALVLRPFSLINQAVHILRLYLAVQLRRGTDQHISSKKSSALRSNFISNCFY